MGTERIVRAVSKVDKVVKICFFTMSTREADRITSAQQTLDSMFLFF